MNAHGLTGHRTRETNYGPPTRPKGIGFYGHHRYGAARRRFHVNEVHAQALRENAMRRSE